ncbi:hypothetical protein [Nevskia ramosa]|uniref:hypothetical protein n=1 Tax=Nevskia ramosa TaxID=64002 RepID=UPI003D0CBEA9
MPTKKDPFEHSGAASFARASAESRLFAVFDRAAERAIAEMKAEGYSRPQTTFTSDERRELREAFAEWQALDVIFKKRSTESEFFHRNKRRRTFADEAEAAVSEAKNTLWSFLWKTLFFSVTFIAALMVIFR